MTIKVLGHRDSLYVVQDTNTPEDTAYIVNANNGTVYPPTPLASIQARGKWYGADDAPTERLQAIMNGTPVFRFVPAEAFLKGA